MDLKRCFERNGYVVIPGMLSVEEASHYRIEIQKLSGLGDADFAKTQFECPDGVSKNRAFWPLIYHPKLVKTLRQVLGPEIRYTRNSDIHAHRTGGWHRDCACREYGKEPDRDFTKAPYRVARVAIYLQTFAESGSSLGLIAGSRGSQRQLGRGARIWRKYLELRDHLGIPMEGSKENREHPFLCLLTSKFSLPKIGRPEWIRTEPGDAIIFDHRCYHCSSSIRGPKYAIYLTYSHQMNMPRILSAIIKNLLDQAYGVLDPDLVGELRKRDLDFVPNFTMQQQALLREYCVIPR